MGANVSLLISVLNASWQAKVHSKVIYLVRRLHNGLDIEAHMPRKDLISFTILGVGNLDITILDLSTSISLEEIIYI